MNSKWPSASLAELCLPDRGITYGIVKVGDYIPGGVPIIRGGDIRDGRVFFDDAKRVTPEVSNQFRRTILCGGELVMNLISEPGHVAFVPPEFTGFNVSRDVAVIALSDRVDHKYVLYYLKSAIAVDWFTARLQGSVTEKINLGTLSEIPIPLPHRRTQCAIAHILGSLDDKIEVNRRTNETLEAMALAIFKSWFVDFDPVRAKMDGRKPEGMDSTTANLFPDGFEESELGLIPKGWRLRPLGDLIELKRGHDLPERERKPGSIPIYSSSGLTGHHDTAKAKTPGVVTGRYGTIGQVFFVEEDFWPLNTTLYVNDFRDSVPHFVFHLLRTIDFQSFVDKAAVPGINRNHVHEAKVIAPPTGIQQRFSELLEPLLRRQRSNLKESVALIAIRDAMLPKLLTGEILVSDAKRKVV